METANAQFRHLFQRWKSEHLDLDLRSMELMTWVNQQSRSRESQFQEAVKRIKELYNNLLEHFLNEQSIGQQLVLIRGNTCPEAMAVVRQSERDHAMILSRLRHLIDRLNEMEVEKDGWKSSMSELSLIIDSIEQHEEQESESVECLIPNKRLPSS